MADHQDKYSFNLKNPKDRSKNIGANLSVNYINNKLDSKGKLLDIGCGNGALLIYAKESGWEVEGSELVESIAKFVKNELNIDVKVGNFMNGYQNESTFDLVTFRHVLEHIPNSIKVMNEISRLLVPRGYAMMEFPNIEALSLKYRRFLSNMGYKKKYSEGYQPGHCNEFSRESFQYLCDKTGFELLDWQTYSYSSIKNSIYRVLNTSTKARVLIRKKS
jgi:2-polyprenyl-3-methyl-5-hydroxy-6-metoxy-1,4-benzoquinol methylase